MDTEVLNSFWLPRVLQSASTKAAVRTQVERLVETEVKLEPKDPVGLTECKTVKGASY